MRLSTNERDVGYRLWSALYAAKITPRVYFNGVKQSECIMADSESGVIIRAKLDAAGGLQCDSSGVIQEEVLTGKVQILLDLET